MFNLKTESPEWVQKLPSAQDASVKQLFVVAGMGMDLPDLDVDASEHIVDYDYHYRYCLNISFNEEGTVGRGAAIFLHCFGPIKPFTAGCVSVPENIMKMIMQNVTEDCVVVIDTLENLGGEF
ncbi:MAG: hypothetical protein IKW76_02330 [Clostridia bacterium]|nr:hypothetical protein [Clostridia bacterium]